MCLCDQRHYLLILIPGVRLHIHPLWPPAREGGGESYWMLVVIGAIRHAVRRAVGPPGALRGDTCSFLTYHTSKC